MPKTQLGKWSFGLFIIFILLLLFSRDIKIPLGGFIFPTIAALAAFITGAISIKKYNERAVSVYITVGICLLGVIFALIFLLGEVLQPH